MTTIRRTMLVLPVLAAAAAVAVPMAFAAQHEAKVPPEVAARQAHMKLSSFQLAVLGPMAQAKVDYDAEAASAAAANLAAIASLDQSRYWTEGTSTDDLVETQALPAIWEDMDGFREHIDALATASQTLSAEAGNGLEALQAAFGPVGQACGACHDKFRMKNN